MAKQMRCKNCLKTSHYSYQCRYKGVRTTLKKKGKIGKQWDLTRAKWLKDNPQAVFTCHICGKPMLRKYMTLDHIKSRSRYPELRFVQSNLAPAHWECNERKGSKDIDEIRNKD